MTSAPTVFTASLGIAPALPELEREWRALESRADASFFLAWPFIGTWLELLPSALAPQLLRVTADGATTGLGLLVANVYRRRGLPASRGLFLHRTGNDEIDEITVEYNGMLATRGVEAQVMRAGMTHLLHAGARWDELFLDGLGPDASLPGDALGGARLMTLRSEPCHRVDLGALRDQGQEYVASLGKSTRYNVRRSLREYEAIGPLQIEEATSIAQARDFLGGLRDHHQSYWRSRGHPGSFAGTFFREFHDRLLDRAFPAKAIQLLRVTAGATEIGYLYNFVHHGHVSNYQSGFAYSGGSAQLRPGLVCHVMAVEHNLRRGHLVYDFLAGDDQYKRNLSTSSSQVQWQVVQQPRLRFGMERLLRAAYQRLQPRPQAPGKGPDDGAA